MKQYKTYKDSGVEWIGEIPDYWESWKIGHAFKKVGSGTTPQSGNPIYYENGTINWLNTGDLNDGILYSCAKKVTQKALEDISSLKLFPKGSLVIAMYGATIGKTALLQFETTTNQACCVFNESDIIDIHFLQYWFKGNKEHIINLAIGGGQPNISQDILKGIRLYCPSKKEQIQISNYLNHKTAQLDTLIAKKRQLISLLQEERTAIIDEFLKPKHNWKSVPIRYLIMGGFLKQQDGNHGELHPIASEYTEKGIPFVMANHLVNEKIDLESCKYISEERANKLRIGFAREGDVLLTHKGTLGRVAIVESISTKYVMLTPQVTYYRCLKGLNNIYLKLFFQSSKFQNKMRFIGGEGTTRAYVGLLAQRNIVIDFPNEITEQVDIVKKIDSRLNINSDLINKFTKEIELLKEYKTALISEVVTGKIDVGEEVIN